MKQLNDYTYFIGENEYSEYKYSEWTCYLFGGDSNCGITWNPLIGKHPNFFWRWMQFICFGNRWVKEEKDNET